MAVKSHSFITHIIPSIFVSK